MKANITSGNKVITINGLDYGRGSISALEEYGNTGVKVYPQNDNPFVIMAEGSSGDGEPFADQGALMTFLQQYTPMDGSGGSGGSGGMVDWNDVRNKPLHEITTPIADAEGEVAVYTQKGQLPVGIPEFPENAVPLILLDVRAPELEQRNFLVGGEDGNEQRKIVGTDLNITQASNNWFVPRWNPVQQEWGGTAQLVTPSPNTSVIRTSSGQGKFSPAVNDDEAITLGQYKSMTDEDDSLTEDQTQSMLNQRFPNAAPGFIFYTPNVGSGMVYFKTKATGKWLAWTAFIVE